MPFTWSESSRASAFSLIARSEADSVSSRCQEAAHALSEQGIAVPVRTLRRWCLPPPESDSLPTLTPAPARTWFIVNEQSHLEVMAVLAESEGQTSVRKIAQEVNMSKSTVHKILKKEKLHAYRHIRKPASNPTRDAKRMEFCSHMLALIDVTLKFFIELSSPMRPISGSHT